LQAVVTRINSQPVKIIDFRILFIPMLLDNR
jgi:hypothetical protein